MAIFGTGQELTMTCSGHAPIYATTYARTNSTYSIIVDGTIIAESEKDITLKMNLTKKGQECYTCLEHGRKVTQRCIVVGG